MTLDGFDPNAAADTDAGIFGLPFTPEESALVFLPVPWEATTSYGGGTAGGPAAILNASHQVDLFHRHVLRPYTAGMAMLEESAEVRALNDEARPLARNIIDVGGRVTPESHLAPDLRRVNELSGMLNEWVRRESARVLASGKIVALVGGDHSTPFGMIQAVAEKFGEFDILQFDAHCDFRAAYEGFEYSHASIMHNVMTKIPQVRKITQVGIRDFCEEEIDFAESLGERCAVFFDDDISARSYRGEKWDATCEEIVAGLGQDVWISFDIDGLLASLCPNTGTPTPGGLDFNQAVYLVEKLVRSGRRLIGFDLNEVSPDASGANEWDANVGARMLYNLSAWTLASQKKVATRT
jgi:agmatinase